MVEKRLPTNTEKEEVERLGREFIEACQRSGLYSWYGIAEVEEDGFPMVVTYLMDKPESDIDTTGKTLDELVVTPQYDKLTRAMRPFGHYLGLSFVKPGITSEEFKERLGVEIANKGGKVTFFEEGTFLQQQPVVST